MQARNDAAEAVIKEIGPRAYSIPSADHPHVMAGQGTIALELLEQVLSVERAY